MNEMAVNLVFEDVLSQAVLLKLLRTSGRRFLLGMLFNSRGSGWIRSRIRGLNQAAQGMGHLVLTDLDQGECAPGLVSSWFGETPRHPNLLFCVAVREVEAWLLAGRESMGRFLGVDEHRIPERVEEIDDPKLLLINLARHSRKADIRRDIPPRSGSTARIGPGCNARMLEYIEKHWNPNTARTVSPSLRRAMDRLSEFTPMVSK
jgi:hypothetical protein